MYSYALFKFRFAPLRFNLVTGILSLTICLFMVACSEQTPSTNPADTNFNDGWEFALEGEDFQAVQIPHDWSVGFAFDSIKGEGAASYLLGGKGTYRKIFPSPASGLAYLHFDGVYNNATVNLNGSSLGRKKLADFPDHIYKWAVPYAAGELEVKGYATTGETNFQLNSAKAPTTLALTTEGEVEGGIEHLIVQLLDEDGLPVRYQEKEISFKLIGEAELLGVDNGAATNTYAFQGGKVLTENGRVLAIIRRGAADAELLISAPGIPDITHKIVKD